MSPKFAAMLFCLTAVCSADLSAQNSVQTEGDRDYRDSRNQSLLQSVEGYHFNLDVQMLLRGQNGAEYPGPDLKFVLRYFPNHPGALDAMGRLWHRYRNSVRSVPPRLEGYQNADYYFTRASNFAPDDGVVRMLYGAYLLRSGRNDQALIQYEASLDLEPKSPEVHYNAGLFFVAFGDHERAIESAKFAYEAGFPLPGLRNKLMKIGVWDGVVEKTPDRNHLDHQLTDK